MLIFLVMNSPLQIHNFKYKPLKNLGLNIREHKAGSVYKICQEIKRSNCRLQDIILIENDKICTVQMTITQIKCNILQK